MVRVNYYSIAAVIQMRKAWIALEHQDEYQEKTPDEWIAEFETGLQLEMGAISEPGEDELAHRLAVSWRMAKKEIPHVSRESSSQIYTNLAKLSTINEAGMLKFAHQSERLGRYAFALGILFLLLTVSIAFAMAHDLSRHLEKAFPSSSGSAD